VLRKLLIIVLFLGAIGSTTGGCGTAPVLEITRQTAIVDHVAIAGAIERGLADKGWRVESHTLGTYIAAINAGQHFARIEVAYDQEAYRIRHVETSPGLKFDGHKVHRRYNRWVSQLDAVIMRELNFGP